MKQLRLVSLLAAKDLRIEYRSRQAFLSTLFFALLVLVVFNFAFDPGSPAAREASPGILWAALLFPGIVQLQRSFQTETEEGTLAGLILAPLDRGAFFLGKFLANWTFLLILDTLVLLAFLLSFNLAPGPFLSWLALLMVLAIAGFAAVGTVFAAMVSSLKAREVLLPILLFPILIPIILAAVNGTQELLVRQEIRFLSLWIQVLVAFDIIYLAAGYLVFEYVVGE